MNVDNKFRLTITNEIYDDGDKFSKVDEKKYEDLLPEWQTQLLKYELNVVVIGEVTNEEELNLLFLRLQLGQILNAGERLHAMTGDMREYVFNNIGKHEFFHNIRIPYRRFARNKWQHRSH